MQALAVIDGLMNEILLLTGWGCYFYLHSLLAATPIKEFFTRNLFTSPRYYRLLYNSIFLAGIMGLVCAQFSVDSLLLFQPGNVIIISACVTSIVGLMIMLKSIANYDWKSFIGITKEIKYPLVINGPNKFVRHPLYTGTLIFVLGLCLLQPYLKHFLFLFLMAVYLAIGIIYEEKKLVKMYGQAYIDYQQKVKKLIPGIF